MSYQLRDITLEEWEQYEWTPVTLAGVGTIYLRGVKRTQLPNDGYKYIESTTFGDTEQKWTRAKTPVTE